MNGACPNCGGAVEFRKYETRRKCPRCKKTIMVTYEPEPELQAIYRVVEPENADSDKEADKETS